ncbi:hypothetical protein NBT05_10670 [Aquimarina sp. ERC-38]|uniref:hypothetical protein n=1 Tax=Aquimarina sp. ERC-38 TaxID=2949996 RepID=UPI00224802B8|nr:hypothetical protein [Aquimarina sp. ERC-38]UZO79428.1 hypothetical protein NBT05_10670 [Aquimarina sp. ERC-38]
MFAAHSYLKFLLASTNQHGIHSPFVYDLVTKGLYPETIAKSEILHLKSLAKNNKTPYKSLELFVKTINFLKIHSVTCSGLVNPEKFLYDIQNSFHVDVQNSSTKSELFYLNLREKCVTGILEIPLSDLVLENKIVFVNNIHQNKKSYSLWQEWIQEPKITVSIDLFYAGLLFIRPQQVKEHFMVRY